MAGVSRGILLSQPWSKRRCEEAGDFGSESINEPGAGEHPLTKAVPVRMPGSETLWTRKTSPASSASLNLLLARGSVRHLSFQSAVARNSISAARVFVVRFDTSCKSSSASIVTSRLPSGSSMRW